MQIRYGRRLRASWLAIVALAVGCLAIASGQPAEAQRTATITYFDEPLDPYGYWVDDPTFGRVWRPRDPGPDWRPYTYGRWVYTSDYGWVWVSDEPWGWVVYHYGRWVWTSRYGWVWVAGDEWAPAWVEWCYGGGYVGWAPAPRAPDWQGGYYYGTYACDSPAYYSRAVYVRESDFLSARVSAHVLLPSKNAIVARGSVNVTNYGRTGAGIINSSVDAKALQAATGQVIRPVRVVQSKSPIAPGASLGATQELRIYRPVVRAAGTLTPPPLNPNLKLDPDLAGVPPAAAGGVSLPPLDSPGVGSLSPPSTSRIGAPPLDTPSIGGSGPSLGNPVGSTIGTVRGRLGR